MVEKYSHKTVVKIMTDKVPKISHDATVSDVESLLIKEAANFDSISYVYLLSSDKKLEGVISLKELFRSPKAKLVRELTPGKVISVHAHTTQERAALLALKHNLKALPVVDSENNFLGVITSDSIIRILDSEAVEDILKFGGINSRASLDDVLSLSLVSSLKHRLPWLVIGLFGGIATSFIVGTFEEVISKNVILAAFIPLMAYMANAVGAQMQAFIIRDFAIDPRFKFTKYFLKHTVIALIIAIIVSAILYAVNILFNNDQAVSLVLGGALFISIMTSLLTGLIIPYLFGKMKMDPANASGPIATIIQDAISVFIYFYVASLIL